MRVPTHAQHTGEWTDRERVHYRRTVGAHIKCGKSGAWKLGPFQVNCRPVDHVPIHTSERRCALAQSVQTRLSLPKTDTVMTATAINPAP